MFRRRITPTLLTAALLCAAMCAGCGRRGTDAPSNASSQPANAAPAQAQSSAIELEIVAPQQIAGSIAATGKVLVPEDRVANIGPVHEGRIVSLYAGQGSV